MVLCTCLGNDKLLQVHDDIIKWKHFPHYWPFVRGIHRWSVNSPHKGQWSGALMFSLICAWINGWVNNCEAGDLRRHRAHYDIIVMFHSALQFMKLAWGTFYSYIDMWVIMSEIHHGDPPVFHQLILVLTESDVGIIQRNSLLTQSYKVLHTVLSVTTQSDVTWCMQCRIVFIITGNNINSLYPERFQWNVKLSIFSINLVINGWAIFV